MQHVLYYLELKITYVTENPPTFCRGFFIFQALASHGFNPTSCFDFKSYVTDYRGGLRFLNPYSLIMAILS